MNSKDRGLCPLPGIGHCLYERCPYWDDTRQECDAACYQTEEWRDPELSDAPCVIHWTEDYD